MFELKHKKCAFSLIELMVAIAISSVIFYASYLIMSSSSEAYQLTTRNLKLQYQARKAANTIVSDLRQSNVNNIFGTGGWSAAATGSTITLSNNEAIVYSSARDMNGDFITDATDHTPIWQAIIVCAPFINPELNQLRRYRIYGAYDFPVTITNVSSSQITVRDSSGATVIINRTSGAPGLMDVLTNDFNQAVLTAGNPINIVIRNSSTTVRGRTFSSELTTNATSRNQ